MKEFERDLLDELGDWLHNRKRKPLVLTGMRRVGKTTLLRVFAKRKGYELLVFDFKQDTWLKSLFLMRDGWDARKTLAKLLDKRGLDIKLEKTLIMFDEVQEYLPVLKALLLFTRDLPEYRIIAVGTLVDVCIDSVKEFATGDFDWMCVKPLSFNEYLRISDPELYRVVDNHLTLLPYDKASHEKLCTVYQLFQMTGGQPVAVDALLDGADGAAVDELLRQQCNGIRDDIRRMASPKIVDRALAIWDNMPLQLMKDNHKFNYSFMKEGARARDYEKSLSWLERSGLVRIVYCNKKPFVPLERFDDKSSYKLYYTDCGLMRIHAGVTVDVLREPNPLYTELRKALAETAVLQSLTIDYRDIPRYWLSLGKAELEFIIQDGDDIYPIEVLLGNKLSGRSLQVYNMIFSPKLMIRFSTKNLQKEDNLLYIPYYMADRTRFILLRSKLDNA